MQKLYKGWLETHKEEDDNTEEFAQMKTDKEET